MSYQNTISDLTAIEAALVDKANEVEGLEREASRRSPALRARCRAAHRELGVLRAARLLRLDLAELEDRIAATG